MAEQPTIGAVWLDADQNYGLAVQDDGTWHLLEARYGRKLTDDEIAGMSHATWHNHPDDPTVRLAEHVASLNDKDFPPRFPWMQ